MPDTRQTIPLFGMAAGRKSANVSAALRTNMYAEVLPGDGDKTQVAYYARPGLVRTPIAVDTSLSGSVIPNGPIRGLINAQYDNSQTSPDTLYLAVGKSFVRMDNLNQWQSMILTAPVNTTGSPIRFAYNGVRALATDGLNMWNMQATFAVGTDGFITAPPAIGKTLAFLGGYYFMEDPSNPGRFRWSDAYAGTTWQALNYATAELAPDPLTGVFAARGELWLFGTSTLEFWGLQVTSTGQQPVQRIQGASCDWGTTAYDTIRQVGGSGEVCFLGRNLNGQRQVIMVQGYKPTVISTPDVDVDIAADPTPDAAVATVEIHSGHTWYVLNLTNKSWALDLTSTQKAGYPVWEVWSTEGGRYAGQWTVTAWGQQLQSDYRDQRLYRLDASVYTDDGATMVREIVTKHLAANTMRLSCNEVQIDCETGVGRTLPGTAVTLSGGGDYITIPDVAAHNIGPPITIEVLATVNAITSDAREFIRKIDAGGTNKGWAIQMFNGVARGAYVNGAGVGFITPGVPVDLGVPTRWSLTIGTTAMNLYQNGVLKATVAVSGASGAPSGQPLTVGALSPYSGNPNPSEFAPITVSDVRLWNIERVAADMLADYGSRLTGTETGLVSYWKMDEGQGGTVTDTKAVKNGNFTTFDITKYPVWTAYTFWANTTSAQTDAANPQIMLQWSKDGGHTWGNEVWQSLGPIGGYLKKVFYRALGRSQDFVFKLRVTSPVKVVIIGAAGIFSP